MKILLSLTLFIFTFSAYSQGDQKYRVSMIQAAPGKLQQLIVKIKPGNNSDYRLMRHSQGDQWDLWLIQPLSDNSIPDGPDIDPKLIALKEDLIAIGPASQEFINQFDSNGYYHIEMFVALPGLDKKLYQEREMENAYLKALGRPVNMIFTNTFGSRWTSFTIGFYRDLGHYAESGNIPIEEENRAAVIAGFESASTIGFYLRSLIREHHDTLVTAVR